MNFFIASDLHGSAYYVDEMLEAYAREGADQMILLGDLLYHGPRNDLPRDYAPKQVITMLNEHKQDILAVRGNCDAEVDQMVLEFPIMADYAVITYAGKRIYLSHGHIYHYDHLPFLQDGDVFMQGHTHILKHERRDGHLLLNPGSVSIPKENNPHTYAMLSQGAFTIKTLTGEVMGEEQL